MFGIFINQCISVHCDKGYVSSEWMRLHHSIYRYRLLIYHDDQNLPGKLGQRSSICWNSLDLFRVYGLNYIFLGITLFCFSRYKSWNFQHLFEKEFRETSQNFNSFSSLRQFLFPFFLPIIWLSWNLVRFHTILF